MKNQKSVDKPEKHWQDVLHSAPHEHIGSLAEMMLNDAMSMVSSEDKVRIAKNAQRTIDVYNTLKAKENGR